MTTIVGICEELRLDFADTPPVIPVPFGQQVLRCGRVDLLAVNRIYAPDGKAFVLFALGTSDPKAGGFGMYLAFPASAAREFAASILKVADRLDNGKGKQ